jgi:hypothetical protein
MQDKPTNLPTTQPNGEQLKSIIAVMFERRATMHFTPDLVPDEYLNAIELTTRVRDLRLGRRTASALSLTETSPRLLEVIYCEGRTWGATWCRENKRWFSRSQEHTT